MNWYQIGSYIWTACGASWIYIAFLMDIPSAFITGLVCLLYAYVWPLLK